jgi:aminoglycoside 6'-N-acetyltransferase
MVGMMDPHKISFKTLEEQDFTLFHKWVNIDFVTSWYDRRKFIFDDVEREYTHQKTDTPVESYIVSYDTVPVGYIQTYRVHDYPDYALCTLVDRHTAGMDLFIGNRDYNGKGLGTLIIQSFLKQIVFTKEEIYSCIVGHNPNNALAIRSFEKAGFSYLKTVTCGLSKEPEYIMEVKKTSPEGVIFPSLES